MLRPRRPDNLYMCSLMAKLFRHSQVGVQTVELALTLPLVLFIIFGTIDIARIVAAYSSVRTATAIGTRQAVGELRPEPAGVGSVMNSASPIGSGYYSAMMGTTNWANQAFFAPGTSMDPAMQSRYRENCEGKPLNTIYRYEVRALAWANFILHSNSPKVSYPCPRSGITEQCFRCCILRSSGDLYEKLFSLQNPDTGNSVYSAKFIGIQCTQIVPMTTAMIGLGALSPFIAVSGTAYIPVSNYAGNHFDTGL